MGGQRLSVLRMIALLLVAGVTPSAFGAMGEAKDSTTKASLGGTALPRAASALASLSTINVAPGPQSAAYPSSPLVEISQTSLLASLEPGWEVRLEQAAVRNSAGEAANLPLPEPGPFSATIATLALAAFVFVRRLV